MSNLFNMPRVEAQDSSGGVLAGAKLEFFETGTSTNLDTYSDDALTTANANPVVADSAGRWAAIFLRDQDYKVTLSDSDDVQIWSADPVRGGVDNLADDTFRSTLATTGSGATYALTVNRVITAYANGDLFIAKSNFANTGSATLNVTGGQSGASALGAKTIKKQAAGAQVNLNANDILNSQWLVLKYDGTNMQLLSPVANAANEAKGGDIASATTIVIDTDGSYFDITGSTGPIGTMTVAAGRRFTLQFNSTPTITDGANIDLGGADIVAAAGDRGIFFATADNTVQLVSPFFREGSPPQGITQATVQTASAGDATFADFTGIPAWVKRITIMFDLVSTDGTEELMIQIGDAGGLETSAYNGSVVSDSGASITQLGASFLLTTVNVAARNYMGVATLTLMDTGNKWAFSSIVKLDHGVDIGFQTAGVKDLSATLTQIRFSTDGTPDDFDNGAVNILYE